MRTLLAFLVLSATCLAVGRVGQRPSIVSGEVQDEYEKPVADSSVRLNGLTVQLSATTDATGHFSFGNVPAGDFLLDASSNGYVDGRYEQLSADDPLQHPIHVTDGATIDHVVLTLWTMPVVAGTVANAQGDPLAGLPVRILARQNEGGVDVFVTKDRTISDRQGHYHFAVAPGRYLVAADASTLVPRAKNTDNTPLFYVYYPNTLSPSASTPLDLQTDDDIEDVNVSVPIVPFGSIEGALIVPPGVAKTLSIDLSRADAGINTDLSAHTASAPDGSFDFRGLPPGDYIIRVVDLLSFGRHQLAQLAGDTFRLFSGLNGSDAPGNSSSYWAREVVTIGNSGTILSGIRVPLHKCTVVQGHIVFSGDSPSPSDTELRNSSIMLMAVGDSLAATPVARMGSDGSFNTSVVPGEYLWAALLGFSGWTVRSWNVLGQDTFGIPFNVDSHDLDDVTIDMTDHQAIVSGVTSEADGHAAAGASIVAFPAAYPAWRYFGAAVPGSVVVTHSDVNGQFVLRGVKVGVKYQVASFWGELPDDWKAMLERLSKSARPITLSDGQQLSVNIKVLE